MAEVHGIGGVHEYWQLLWGENMHGNGVHEGGVSLYVVDPNVEE